ncbi:hypothetical protein OIO90_000129 [Microbotryomycetes sp. JL221]|nr:hypothetical protein OIO90_000129 [Microbotryomycetes sp. JL221]
MALRRSQLNKNKRRKPAQSSKDNFTTQATNVAQDDAATTMTRSTNNTNLNQGNKRTDASQKAAAAAEVIGTNEGTRRLTSTSVRGRAAQAKQRQPAAVVQIPSRGNARQQHLQSQEQQQDQGDDQVANDRNSDEDEDDYDPFDEQATLKRRSQRPKSSARNKRPSKQRRTVGATAPSEAQVISQQLGPARSRPQTQRSNRTNPSQPQIRDDDDDRPPPRPSPSLRAPSLSQRTQSRQRPQLATTANSNVTQPRQSLPRPAQSRGRARSDTPDEAQQGQGSGRDDHHMPPSPAQRRDPDDPSSDEDEDRPRPTVQIMLDEHPDIQPSAAFQNSTPDDDGDQEDATQQRNRNRVNVDRENEPNNPNRPNVFVHMTDSGDWKSDKVWMYPKFATDRERQHWIDLLETNGAKIVDRMERAQIAIIPPGNLDTFQRTIEQAIQEFCIPVRPVWIKESIQASKQQNINWRYKPETRALAPPLKQRKERQNFSKEELDWLARAWNGRQIGKFRDYGIAARWAYQKAKVDPHQHSIQTFIEHLRNHAPALKIRYEGIRLVDQRRQQERQRQRQREHGGQIRVEQTQRGRRRQQLFERDDDDELDRDQADDGRRSEEDELEMEDDEAGEQEAQRPQQVQQQQQETPSDESDEASALAVQQLLTSQRP